MIIISTYPSEARPGKFGVLKSWKENGQTKEIFWRNISEHSVNRLIRAASNREATVDQKGKSSLIMIPQNKPEAALLRGLKAMGETSIKQ